MILKKQGTITNVTELSKTAREITVTLEEALPCPPGSFVNFFMDVNGTPVRRAYSVVHADEDAKTITLAIRHTLNGTMTPEFWKEDILGRTVSIMGPLGANTAEKLSHKTVHLFAYGVGAGVIKAIAEYSLLNPHVEQITITTGSRNEEDILYKDYFDAISRGNSHVSVRYVISDPVNPAYPFKGYVQDHIGDLTFKDADIYMCGQEKACNALKEKINSMNPKNVTFLVEAFH